MKLILFSFVFCFASLFCEVDAQTQVVKDSLSVTKTVGLQQMVYYDDYEVKFKRVITDSRCPKSVMCIRAGEAEVLISIYKNGNFIADKKIRIDASGYVMESNNLAFDTKFFKIYGFGLTPYPVSVNDIEDKDYELEIMFQPKSLK